MLRMTGFIVAMSTLLSASTAAQDRDKDEDRQPAFTYACDTCPANWGFIEGEDYGNCAEGTAQSPICVMTATAKYAQLPRLRFRYREVDLDLEDVGVNVEAFGEGQRLWVGGKRYDFVQFHFHSLSEHFVDGEQLPLEMHLVHRAADGSLLVLGRFIEIGDESFEPLQPFVDGLDDPGAIEDFDLRAFVPSQKHSYRYVGSTTTPPCAGDVQWILLQERLRLSAAQVADIRASLRGRNEGFDNFRPLQSLNGRIIMTDVDPGGGQGGDDDDDDDDGGADDDD